MSEKVERVNQALDMVESVEVVAGKEPAKAVPTPAPTKVEDKQAGTPIQLPSRGLYYGEMVPGGTLFIRGITMAEEKLLASSVKDELQMMALFDRMMQLCIVHPKVNLNEFLISDKFYLLLMLRVVSLGGIYSFSTKCTEPICGVTFTHSIDLTKDIAVKPPDPDSTEPFSVVLPDIGADLELKLFRWKDELSALKQERRSYQKALASAEGEAAIFRLAQRIVRINGSELDILAKMKWLEKLSLRDSIALRDAVDEVEYLVETNIEITCPRCGVSWNVILPQSPEFFRPKSDKARGSLR